MTTVQETTLSPGERFARAYLDDGPEAEVWFDYTLSDAFQPVADRPRLTARNLFKHQRVAGDTVRGWFETRPYVPGAEPGLREAAFRFELADYRVRPIAGWVQIPDGLAEHPESLVQFIDRRLMVRLGT
ncbi:hypothetical protein N566_01590, partial [Streptomycetaceae bacterium MP113-05]